MTSEPAPRWTAPAFRALKGRRRIAMLTAVDAVTARACDDAGLPAILVGDSLAMTVLGLDTTLPLTLDEMLHHVRAVVRGAARALVIADLPFLSYQVSADQAVLSAGRCLQAGAGAVKLEGGRAQAPVIARLVANGIPVMGHLGLLPQHVRAMGGYRVQGRTAEEAARLVEDARALEDAGVFALVVEGVPAAVGEAITRAVTVPTIGIGAGAGCDGQVLVIHDLLGFTPDPPPRFVRRYADLGARMRDAIGAYRDDVAEGRFPGPENTYGPG